MRTREGRSTPRFDLLEPSIRGFEYSVSSITSPAGLFKFDLLESSMRRFDYSIHIITSLARLFECCLYVSMEVPAEQLESFRRRCERERC